MTGVPTREDDSIMDFLRRYSLILGLSTLILVIVLLLSSSELLFSSGVTFIDTELNRSSGNEVYVKTRLDFGDYDQLAAFPMKIGEWTGWPYPTEKWEEVLKTDLMIMRGYTRPGILQPIFFLAMQADTESSFHPPHICYAAQDYTVVETSKDSVIVTDPILAGQAGELKLPLERLIVVKKNKTGDVIERRVVLHFYVKGNQFTTNTITWVRLEALTPTQGSYEAALTQEKELLAAAMPLMFSIADKDEWNPIILKMADWGAGGCLLIVLLFAVPAGFLLFPRTRWGKRRPRKEAAAK